MHIKKIKNMNERDLHPKLTHSIELMLLNSKVGYPYYGEFNQQINFHARPNDPSLPTAGVNVTQKGMNFYYNPEFLDGLTQEQTSFLVIHEDFHLLWDHQRRSRMGGYDHKLSNIVQDMIINTVIVQDIKPSFIDIPKDRFGQNTALFIDKSYKGEWVYEIMYDWIKERWEEYQKKRDKKEDNKVFDILFFHKNRPSSGELQKNFAGQSSTFRGTLLEHSKEEYDNYSLNFTRKVLNSLEQGIPVTFVGHSSSIIPDGETSTYNDDLSLRRAELCKNAIIDNIDSFIEVYGHCLEIIKEDEKISEAKKIDFILKYEEIANETIKKQRTAELLKNDPKAKGNKIQMLFRQYRFSELCRMDLNTLKNLAKAKNITVPSASQLKTTYIGLAQNLIKVEGKGSKEPIITNETDSSPSVIRTDLAGKNKFNSFKNITDPEKKQDINRRVEFIFDESQDSGGGGGSGMNEESYGKNGVNGEECHSLDEIFEGMEGNNGQFLDSHMQDEVPEELREQMVKDAMERLKARGLVSGDIEKTLDKLQKKRKDYLKEIKRGVSFIKGNQKERTITRPNRKGIVGLKGRRKIGAVINCILDTSGSMGGYFEKALSFIFRSDIEINLIQIDTEIQSVHRIKSMKELKKVVISGHGGTTMKLAFDLIAEKYNNLNSIMLTDGFVENLDVHHLKGKLLIISNNVECPIAHSNGKVKQIVIKDFDTN